ncbi:MAG: hypothetical protein LUQ40_05640 [Methanomicrobiales archaeon]|nr:hypothetical protein [Methanomicrobiales archaeon]
MNARLKAILLTSGAIILSALVLLLEFSGQNLLRGFLIVCAIWGIYFYLMVR